MVQPTCQGGLGPTTSASTCYTTTSGTCFTDGPGNYGNNERCAISVLRTTGLRVVGSLSLQACCDYFFLTGSTTRYTTATAINNLVLQSGDTLNWRSDFRTTTTGYTICVRFVSDSSLSSRFRRLTKMLG